MTFSATVVTVQQCPVAADVNRLKASSELLIFWARMAKRAGNHYPLRFAAGERAGMAMAMA